MCERDNERHNNVLVHVIDRMFVCEGDKERECVCVGEGVRE